MTERPITRRSLVDQAVDRLKTRIMDGSWPIGSRIPTEPELVAELGISRNTVREAIRVLTVTGMLDVRQGDGSYVLSQADPAGTLRQVNRASLRDHLETRALLEAEIARLAALRRTPEDLEQLERTLAARGECSGPDDLESFVERDLAFHRAVARACGNAALYELYEFLLQSMRIRIAQAISDQQLPDPDLASHRAILDAIRAQNPEAAALAARQVTEPVSTTLDHLIQVPHHDTA